MSSPENSLTGIVGNQAQLHELEYPLNAAAAPQAFVTARIQEQDAWSDARVTAAELKRPEPTGIHVGARVLDNTVFAELRESAGTFMDRAQDGTQMVPATHHGFAALEGIAQAEIARRMNEYHGGGNLLEFPSQKRMAA